MDDVKKPLPVVIVETLGWIYVMLSVLLFILAIGTLGRHPFLAVIFCRHFAISFHSSLAAANLPRCI